MGPPRHIALGRPMQNPASGVQLLYVSDKLCFDINDSDVSSASIGKRSPAGRSDRPDFHCLVVAFRSLAAWALAYLSVRKNKNNASELAIRRYIGAPPELARMACTEGILKRETSFRRACLGGGNKWRYKPHARKKSVRDSRFEGRVTRLRPWFCGPWLFSTADRKALPLGFVEDHSCGNRNVEAVDRT
ncbi:hypothetical protein Q31b_27700 [Novipirellula aureliae]|uniref:Uncharacterized protein n=1 Tax=Novipirellula aureliae TaxID=2527966 RepID=A0A5C6E104_9BACT|nr:hypothetical protein Q31b_27700 [Novipirellula aureliae]